MRARRGCDVNRDKVIFGTLAVLVAASLSGSQIVWQGSPDVDYYGRAVTWQQVELLRTRGMATYGISWDNAGVWHSAAFDRQEELDAFTERLISATKAR